MNSRGVLLVIFYSVFFLSLVHAQNISTDQLICKILNQDSKTPVYYATIKLVGTNLGVVADDKGQFRLPGDLEMSSKIKVSSIGYVSREISISELNKKNTNIIYLAPSVDQLETVTLKSKKKRKKLLSAKQIVKKAIANIDNNYPLTPFSYIAYYRDYQQPADSSYISRSNRQYIPEYINLNESVVQVYDAGFATDNMTHQRNQTVLYSYVENKDFERDNSLSIPYDNHSKKYLENTIIPAFGGNEFNIILLTDALRNHDKPSFSFVENLRENFVANHRFELNQIRFLDTIPIYEIDFSTNAYASGPQHYATGKIFINTENFAIHKLSYTVFESFKDAPLYAITIAYKSVEEKMYLNYITFNNRFEVFKDPEFKIENVVYSPQENILDVFFNNELNTNFITSHLKRPKLKHNGKDVGITNLLVLDQQIQIKLDDASRLGMTDEESKHLSRSIGLMLKGVKDIHGNVLHDIHKLLLNQYREIFVQEVFPNMEIQEGYEVMDKYTPLSKAEINDFEDKSKYWINTPLKKNKKH